MGCLLTIIVNYFLFASLHIWSYCPYLVHCIYKDTHVVVWLWYLGVENISVFNYFILESGLHDCWCNRNHIFVGLMPKSILTLDFLTKFRRNNLYIKFLQMQTVMVRSIFLGDVFKQSHQPFWNPEFVLQESRLIKLV